MTSDQALSCLTELKALERLHAVIAALPSPAFEWRCALTALDDRLRWVRYCLSLEDPATLVQAQERYDQERRLATIIPDMLPDDSMSDLAAAPDALTNDEMTPGASFSRPGYRIH